MTHSEQIPQQIRTFVFHNFPGAKKRAVNDDSPLLESGIIDSLGMLDVVAFLEQTFGIKVEDEELVPDNFASIKALTDFVMNKKMLTPTA